MNGTEPIYVQPKRWSYQRWHLSVDNLCANGGWAGPSRPNDTVVATRCGLTFHGVSWAGDSATWVAENGGACDACVNHRPSGAGDPTPGGRWAELVAKARAET